MRPSAKTVVIILLLVALVILAGSPAGDRRALEDVVAGMSHLDAGEYGAAIARYQSALERTPTDEQIALQLVDAHIDRHETSHALEILNRLEPHRRGERRAQILVRKGEAWLRAGEPDDAAFYWEAALRADPGNPLAHLGLARIAENQGQQGEATYHYRCILLTNPADAEAAYRLGLLLLDMDTVKARESLQQALVTGIAPWAESAGRLLTISHSDSPDPFDAARLGLMLIELEEPNAALRQFELATALAPDYADAHAYRGHLLAQLGRPASDAFAQALTLSPDLVLGHYLLGRYHDSQGLPALARLEYERALRLDADNPALGIDIALTYAEEGDYVTAEQWLDAAIERAPLDPAFALAQAKFYITRGYLVEERGLPAVEIALALNGESAEGHELRGQASYLLGHLDSAITDLERAIALEPNRASAHLQLGMVLLAKGDANGAEWELNRAIDLDPAGSHGVRARSYLK